MARSAMIFFSVGVTYTLVVAVGSGTHSILAIDERQMWRCPPRSSLVPSTSYQSHRDIDLLPCPTRSPLIRSPLLHRTLSCHLFFYLTLDQASSATFTATQSTGTLTYIVPPPPHRSIVCPYPKIATGRSCRCQNGDHDHRVFVVRPVSQLPQLDSFIHRADTHAVA
jgi:hypothetical protein